jgi:hypothetical protein
MRRPWPVLALLASPAPWILNGSYLAALNSDVGVTLYNGGNGPCQGVRSFTSPIAVKGRIIVGADGQLCSWSPH